MNGGLNMAETLSPEVIQPHTVENYEELFPESGKRNVGGERIRGNWLQSKVLSGHRIGYYGNAANS